MQTYKKTPVVLLSDVYGS